MSLRCNAAPKMLRNFGIHEGNDADETSRFRGSYSIKRQGGQTA
jgi:hypothetical protein